MNETVTRQDIVDTEHLRLLAFGYVFSAIMSALMSLLGLLYAGIGFVMSHFFAEAALNATNPDKIPPEALGTIVSVFGGVFFVVLMALALLKFYAASCIRRRKSRLFCQIIAGISALPFPMEPCSACSPSSCSVAPMSHAGSMRARITRLRREALLRAVRGCFRMRDPASRACGIHVHGGS